MVVIRRPKTFYFYFSLLKDVDNNLKHELKFFIKHNESLGENGIKNEIEKLLSKHKRGKYIHE